MTLTPRQRQALKTLARRRAKPEIDFLDGCFPEQRAFLEDPAKMKAALCTRRAGKSYGVGALAIKTALDTPNVKVVIIGKTRDSIRSIYFDDIMEVLRKRYNLSWDLNKTEMTYRLSNSSLIHFMGADADEDQMNKLLGQKFKLVIIDEASMYANIDLEKLVYGILRPALADLRGQVVMIGTPSDYIGSLYFKVTFEGVPGWSVHKWTALDNPYMAVQIAEEEAFMASVDPDYKTRTLYRQHNLGEWVVSEDALVYKYKAIKNSKAVDLPRGYQYVLGVDLGWEDDTAFVVGAWSHYDTQLHIVHVEMAKHMILDEVESRMHRLQNLFGIGVIVIDGASKHGVETMQTRFKIALERADKQGKKDFIELMNMDFHMSNINVLPERCAPLEKEWAELIWDEGQKKRGVWEELKNKPNHAADAALYMWRWCHNYAAIPKVKPLSTEDQMEKDLENRLKRQDEEYEYGFSYEP